MKLDSLCIVIPAYNEEAALPGVLDRSAKAAAQAADSWQILVINDGSTDGTPRILKEFGDRCPQLIVRRHERNAGIAATILEVFTVSEAEWTFFIPGDGQIPPEEIQRLIPYVKEYDLIYAWRRQRADPWRRKLGAWVYNAIISLGLLSRVRDIDSGVLFRSGRLKGLRLGAKSSFVHAEFFIQARSRGLRHIEIPIRHEPRIGGEARGANFPVIISTACEVFGYGLRHCFTRKEL